MLQHHAVAVKAVHDNVGVVALAVIADDRHGVAVLPDAVIEQPQLRRSHGVRIVGVRDNFFDRYGFDLIDRASEFQFFLSFRRMSETIRELIEKGYKIRRNGVSNYTLDKKSRIVFVEKIPDHTDDILSTREIPSWKRMCICILKNDHACKFMGFAETKAQRERIDRIKQKYRSIETLQYGTQDGHGQKPFFPLIDIPVLQHHAVAVKAVHDNVGVVQITGLVSLFRETNFKQAWIPEGDAAERMEAADAEAAADLRFTTTYAVRLRTKKTVSMF